jgi:5-methylcytosine-specific restriction endonuclease McrA
MPYADKDRQRRYETEKKRRQYARRRAALLAKLGGKCALCGSDHGLEFDHIDPATRTWKARGKSRLSLIRRYEHEAAAGLLRVLCLWCNRGWAPPEATAEAVETALQEAATA